MRSLTPFIGPALWLLVFLVLAAVYVVHRNAADVDAIVNPSHTCTRVFDVDGRRVSITWDDPGQRCGRSNPR